MDNTYRKESNVRSKLVSSSFLDAHPQKEGLIIGIVKEAETSDSKLCTVINIETGKDKNFILLMKHNAGFLVGRLVIYDIINKSVSCPDNDSYIFNVIAPVKIPRSYQSHHSLIECPECDVSLNTKNIAKHFKRQHWFRFF